ncbi:MAG TPA: Hsp20/alpha crystallin family protein [Pirellulales bacterium]|nr:Hsp20/alpha crystallin family protein [Pirellulales bacterium]
MSLIPWKHKREENGGSRLAPADSFRQEVDRLFNSFFRDPFDMVETAFAGFTGGEWSPSLDVSETDNEVNIRAELPGVKPEDLDVTVTGDKLVLAGEKKETSETKDKNYWHSETRYGSFRRQVRLPAEVDAEHVDAHFANGVLEVHLKKAQAAHARRISVKTN